MKELFTLHNHKSDSRQHPTKKAKNIAIGEKSAITGKEQARQLTKPLRQSHQTALSTAVFQQS